MWVYAYQRSRRLTPRPRRLRVSFSSSVGWAWRLQTAATGLPGSAKPQLGVSADSRRAGARRQLCSENGLNKGGRCGWAAGIAPSAARFRGGCGGGAAGARRGPGARRRGGLAAVPSGHAKARQGGMTALPPSLPQAFFFLAARRCRAASSAASRRASSASVAQPSWCQRSSSIMRLLGLPPSRPASSSALMRHR